MTIAVCGTYHEANTQSIDTLFLQAAYTKLQNAKAYTLEIANLMLAENYAFKPSPDEMDFGQQLLHLSQNLGWLSAFYLNNEERNPVSKSDLNLHRKDSIIAVVNRAYNYALHALQYLPADQLKDSVSFFAGPMNKVQIINLLNDHQTHHRGQLIVYLRMNGIKPPRYMGW